jgi:hypothetical protein
LQERTQETDILVLDILAAFLTFLHLTILIIRIPVHQVILHQVILRQVTVPAILFIQVLVADNIILTATEIRLMFDNPSSKTHQSIGQIQ